MPELMVRRRWLRYSLSQLLVFSIGFGVGLGVLGLWHYRRPIPTVSIRTQVYEMPYSVAESLKLAPAAGDNAFCSTGPVAPSLPAQLKALASNKTIRCIAEPTLLTSSGRSANFSVGGEIPFPTATRTGAISIEYRKYGTEFNMEPLVLSSGRIQMNVRASFSELDSSQGVIVSGQVVPGVRSRAFDAGIETGNGQSSVIGLPMDRLTGSDSHEFTIMLITPTIQASR